MLPQLAPQLTRTVQLINLPRFQQRGTRALAVTVCALDRSSSFLTPVYTIAELSAKKRETFLNYVNTTYPDENFLAEAEDQIPPLVVQAMSEAVNGLVGNLPAPFFEVNIRAGRQSYSELLLSVMMSGYMLRNLEVTTQLQSSIEQGDQIGEQDLDSLQSDYAPGTQKNGIQGHVIKWHYEKGAEYIPADSYISSLEQQVRNLQNEVQALRANDSPNNLLDVFKRLEREKIEDLTQDMSEEVQEAMQCFVDRLLGKREDMVDAVSETTAGDMSKLLFWVMAVGYRLRRMEHHFDLKFQLLETTSSQLLTESIDLQDDFD
eukprot:TRINITY_DN1200_c0_g1_i6.p1 TRINITY_DN1200_c0_g1~~TRINITY_DN1200_c0_g1_i6.p1  ORF type:complete len:335 (-),score=52.80 TRINITY_DN1200_c0_g1_i6:234-1190(-)